MPRVLKTIHISVRCVSISTSTSGQFKHLELLANAAAPTVSQAMAIPVAILNKEFRGDLCQKCVLVARISGSSWGAAFLGKPRNFQETLGSLWFRIRGKSVTNRHRISDGANTELVSTANSNPQTYLLFQLCPCTPQPTEGNKLHNKSQHECQAWKIYRRLWHDLGVVRAFKEGCPSSSISDPNSAQTILSFPKGAETTRD